MQSHRKAVVLQPSYSNLYLNEKYSPLQFKIAFFPVLVTFGKMEKNDPDYATSLIDSFSLIMEAEGTASSCCGFVPYGLPRTTWKKPTTLVQKITILIG